MEDIELARSLLEEKQWNLVIVKVGQVIFSSQEHGVAPFSQAVQSIGKGLHNAAVADRIVGSAVAMLCLYVGVSSVYAVMASQEAIDMLKEQGITISSKSTVPYISNYDGTDLCPFEKMAKNSENPAQLFTDLKSIFGDHDVGNESQ